MGKTGTTRPMRTAIVATPEASAVGLYSIMDILASVGRDWQMLHGQAPGAAPFVPRLLSVDGAPYVGLNYVEIRPHGSLADMAAPDIVIIPDLHLDPSQPFPNSYAQIAEWVRSAYEQGAVVASVCSGALLLAETGLLDGQEATTHWGYCDVLARRHPGIRVRRERVLLPTGEGHRLITAGGASSWHDLLLYLIGRVAGAEEARRIAKLYLLQWHSEGQLPYAALTAGRNADDKVVAECQVWLADNYSGPNPVAGMVAKSGLGERTFLRRFRAATGMSPRDYLQNLRIEEAKYLLETTQASVDSIGAEVGYAEPSAFRHAFRKRVGISASLYRRRFMAPATTGDH
jgi:transcriptional regulator GlxA family with amidase domain